MSANSGPVVLSNAFLRFPQSLHTSQLEPRALASAAHISNIQRSTRMGPGSSRAIIVGTIFGGLRFDLGSSVQMRSVPCKRLRAMDLNIILASILTSADLFFPSGGTFGFYVADRVASNYKARDSSA